MAANLAGRWVAHSVVQRADQWGVNWAAARAAPTGSATVVRWAVPSAQLPAELRAEMWAYWSVDRSAV